MAPATYEKPEIEKVERQVEQLAASVIQLSESMKKISDHMIEVADSCSTLKQKMVILERDFEDRRIIGFIKKAIWYLYPVLLLTMMVNYSSQHEQLVSLLQNVSSFLQIEV